MRTNHLSLKVIRERSGLSQSAAAEAAGIERPNYAHIEAGRRPGTVEQITRIAAMLRVPIGAVALMENEKPAESAA